MALVTFIRDTLENIEDTPIVDGQILFTTDQDANDNKIFIDVGNKRILFEGNVDYVANQIGFDTSFASSFPSDKDNVQLMGEYIYNSLTVLSSTVTNLSSTFMPFKIVGDQDSRDVSTYIANGIYMFTNSNTPIGAPSGSESGWLVVMANNTDNLIKQVWYNLDQTDIGNKTNTEVYNRTCIFSGSDIVWGAWVRLLTTNDINPSVIGQITSNTNLTGVSVKTGTATNIGEFNIPAGTYIVQYVATFASDDGGTLRNVKLTSNKDDNGEISRGSGIRVAPISGTSSTIAKGVEFVNNSVATKYYIKVYHNCGKNITVSGGYKYMRIK